jgi:integrase/recombinase XerD
MNLHRVIETYIAFQQSLGTAFVTDAQTLRAFGRALGPRASMADIRPRHVEAFLGRARPVTTTWHSKLRRLRPFFRYAVSRGHLAVAPLPTAIPKAPPPFVPYIYSREELRRLLCTIDADARPTCLNPATTHLVVLLLYGAGLRLREALNLTRDDVDLDEFVLTVRNTKFGKTRLVPVGPQLGQALARYAARAPAPRGAAPFFTSRSGGAVKPDTLQHNFRILCERAGIHRNDGAEQPRLHDLRHTFAVHRLTSWYRQGGDVQRLLQHLSVYLGHVHIRHTQVYLSMTPELLREAGQRFEHYAETGGSP